MESLDLDSCSSEQGEIGGCSEYGNVVWGPVKCRGFIDYVRKYWLLKMDS
jgi:hypothetical protein